MALNAEQKKVLVQQYQRGENDTGSPEVQIALLTENIKSLTGHFKLYKKDKHSERGLQGMINRRRKLLNYLKKTCIDRYKNLIERLGLRH